MSDRAFIYGHHGEMGKGDYGKSLAKLTGRFLDNIDITNLVKKIPIADKNLPFNIGDYGTADGSASMIFLKDLMVSLREHHGPQLQFQVIYEDLPNNDFNSLFRRLSGFIQDPPSYLQDLENVFPLASGIEFRKQCVPSESMHFIMSTTAVHWLSKVPVQYKDSLCTYPSCSDEEYEAATLQAMKDWETFLLMRSKELRHGGILMVVCGNGYEKSKGHDVSREVLLDLYTQQWRLFRDTGRITNEEFLNTNFALYIYRHYQLRKPFEDPESAVVESGLGLVAVEKVTLPCPYFKAWEKTFVEDGVDDRESYARNLVNSHRMWSNHTFFSGLSCLRTKEDKIQIVDCFYRMIEDRVKEMHPNQLSGNYICNFVIIKKT